MEKIRRFVGRIVALGAGIRGPKGEAPQTISPEKIRIQFEQDKAIERRVMDVCKKLGWTPSGVSVVDLIATVGKRVKYDKTKITDKMIEDVVQAKFQAR